MDQEFNVDFKKLISFGWAHEKSTETHPFLKSDQIRIFYHYF